MTGRGIWPAKNPVTTDDSKASGTEDKLFAEKTGN